jgi:drug/metabolite transporter superfamily protein YnfA
MEGRLVKVERWKVEKWKSQKWKVKGGASAPLFVLLFVLLADPQTHPYRGDTTAASSGVQPYFMISQSVFWYLMVETTGVR